MFKVNNKNTTATSNNVEQIEFIKGLQLTNTGYHSTESKIDILLGSDCYWKVVSEKIKRDSHTDATAINTMFVWFLGGTFKNKHEVLLD